MYEYIKERKALPEETIGEKLHNVTNIDVNTFYKHEQVVLIFKMSSIALIFGSKVYKVKIEIGFSKTHEVFLSEVRIYPKRPLPSTLFNSLLEN